MFLREVREQANSYVSRWATNLGVDTSKLKLTVVRGYIGESNYHWERREITVQCQPYDQPTVIVWVLAHEFGHFVSHYNFGLKPPRLLFKSVVRFQVKYANKEEDKADSTAAKLTGRARCLF